MQDQFPAVEGHLLNKLRRLVNGDKDSEGVGHSVSSVKNAQTPVPPAALATVWPSVITKDVLFGRPGTEPPSEVPCAVRLVAYGVKPLTLIYGPEEYTAGLVRWAHRRRLFAAMGLFEFIPNADAGKGDFSNRARDGSIAVPGSGRNRQVLIAQDESVLINAWISLLSSSHVELGSALGFPECCIGFFSDNWKKAKAENQGDLAAHIALGKRAGPFDWRYNIFGRYFGLSLIQHFPCSYDCAATLELAKRYEAALRNHEPEHWMRLVELLSSPVLYTERSGVFIFKGATAVNCQSGWEVIYEPQLVMTTAPEGQLHRLIRGATGLTASSPEARVRVGGQELNGILIVFRETPNTGSGIRPAEA